MKTENMKTENIKIGNIKIGNMKTEKTRGAVLYRRVSGSEQAEHGTSLESQRDACRAKALTLGLPVVAEYEDAGISGGFLLSRTGFQGALADIREGRADTLVCASISRFSRDVEHQQAVKKAVKAAGGSLVFCDMEFADTPEGDLNFSIQGSFAEYERKSIAARTEGGRRRRAEQGQQPARSRAPYGYHIVGKEDVLRGDHPAELRGRYLVIESEAATVRAMFDRYASGASTLSGLARWLNAEGVKTKHRGADWAVTTLHTLLSNPVYKGEASYGRHVHTRDEARIGQVNPHTGRPLRTCHRQLLAEPGEYLTWAVPAVVSEEVWDAVQAKFRENAAGCSGNPKRLRMLAGRITCPACGGGMTVYQRGSRKKDGAAYASHVLFQCSRFRWKKQNTGADACDRTAYRIDVVEGAVLSCLQDAATNPASVRDARRTQAEARAQAQRDARRRAGDGQDAAQQAAGVDAELSGLALRHEAVVKAQVAGILAGADASAYDALFAEMRELRVGLEAKRAALAMERDAEEWDAEEWDAEEWDAERGDGGGQGAGRPVGKGGEADGGQDFSHYLAEMRRILSADDLDGATKRDIIGTVIDKVYPEKDGARVVFLPGVFDGPGGHSGPQEGGAAGEPGGGAETLRPYTWPSIPGGG